MPGAVTNKSVVCVCGNACAAWDLGSKPYGSVLAWNDLHGQCPNFDFDWHD